MSSLCMLKYRISQGLTVPALFCRGSFFLSVCLLCACAGDLFACMSAVRIHPQSTTFFHGRFCLLLSAKLESSLLLTVVFHPDFLILILQLTEKMGPIETPRLSQVFNQCLKSCDFFFGGILFFCCYRWIKITFFPLLFLLFLRQGLALYPRLALNSC